MDSLRDLIPVMIRISDDNDDVREQAVFAAWRMAAGTGVANVCEPVRLDKKRLVVAVLDQTWKKQMERISGEYLFKVNGLLRGPYVTFIEFRVDKGTVIKSIKEPDQVIEFKRTNEIADELRQYASGIRDAELREKFLRAAARSIERNGG